MVGLTTSTSTSHTVDPWEVFGAYVFVVFSNIVVAYVVLWLFLRDSHSVAGAWQAFGAVLVLARGFLWMKALLVSLHIGMPPELLSTPWVAFHTDLTSGRGRSRLHFPRKIWQRTFLGLSHRFKTCLANCMHSSYGWYIMLFCSGEQISWRYFEA